MILTVDELVIRVSMAAEGVREGVDGALLQLGRLEEVQKRLSEEIRVRVSEASIQEAMRKITLLRSSGQITREEAHTGFEYLIEAFEWAELQKLEIQRRMYGLRHQMAAQEVQGVLASATGRDATTDFMAIIEALREVQARYVNDIEIVDAIEEEIAQNMMRRNVKLADMRILAMNEEIAAIERRMDVSRRSDGIGFGENAHEHSLELEKAAIQEIIRLVEGQIEFFKDIGQARTDHEEQTLERLLGLARSYYEQLENLELDMARNKMAELEAERESIRTEALEALRQYVQQRKSIQMEGLDAELGAYREAREQKRRELRDSFAEEISEIRRHRENIQQEFDEQIRAVREAVDAEIAEYRRRVEEIDTAIREARREEQDERDRQRIAVIQDSLKFERDDFNRMQLERELERAMADISQRQAREGKEDERRELNAQIREAREAANTQIDILRQARAEALRLYAEETRVRVGEMETQRDAALRLMDEQTRAGLEHFEQRRRDILEFYRDKYEAAAQNAQDEKFLLQRTHEEMYRFLISPKVQDNYASAGQAHGRAYAQRFHAYLDQIAQRIAMLTQQIAGFGFGGPSFGGFAAGLQTEAIGVSLAASRVVQKPHMAEAKPMDARSAIINQTFNISEKELSYHEVKQAAKAGLRLALGS